MVFLNLRALFIISVFLSAALNLQMSGQDVDSVRSGVNGFYPEPIIESSDSNNAKNWEDEPVKGKVFFDSLKVKADQKSWSRQLHRLLVIDTREASGKQSQNGYDRTDYFAQFKGKQIRHIKIKQLDIFGPNVQDTTPVPQNWLQKFGNTLHISTHKSAIKTYLFFEEGEYIDPYLLFDNERIFRTIPNIQDSRIYVVPAEGDTNQVDIMIVVKDVWPIGISAEIYDVVYGNASMWSDNMLGLGHQLKYTAYYNSDPKLETNYGYKIKYRIPNIGNTFTSLELFHEDNWNKLVTKAYLTRDFIVPSMILGGGLGYEKVYQISNFITIDSIYSNLKSEYEYYDGWIGFSRPVKTYEEHNLRKTFFFTARGTVYDYIIRPDVDENKHYEFHNRHLILSSVGFAWQGYHSSRLIYGFGKTEDLPLGAMIKVTGGIESSEFANRMYFGSTFTFSKYLKQFGYLSNSFQYGSFFDNKPEQGVFKYKFLHISALFGNGRHGLRHITELEYNQVFNRFNDEFISIFRNEGIRGLDYLQLRGDKKLYLNSELIYYSPHYLYGFRFVYFAFLDVGAVNYQTHTLFDNPVYSSVGLGLRIRNEHLVFNTIQLRFHFFPFNNNLPGSSKHFVEFSGIPAVKIPDFAKRKPEVIEY